MIKKMFYENQIPEKIFKECERLFKSGGVNPGDYNDGYSLPKILLYVALTNLADQYKPLTNDFLRDAKNLFHF